MDTKKLEALAAAVEYGSFTRAAENLGYTQSGLTHMMNSLEKDIGFPVLLRGRQGVRLTPAGERIFPLIRNLLVADEALGREIGRINTNREETVRIAAYSSIAIHWLPEVIQQFRHNHPGVDVEIRMGNIEDVFRWVSEDKMDLGFASRQEGMTLEWVRLRDDPLLAILPPDYDLDGRHSFPVEGFSGEEFLMPSLGFHQDILRVMRGGGAEPVYRSPQVSDNVIISMVEHGLGLSILSELVLRGRQDDVLAVPLDPPAVREIGVAMRSRKEMPLMVRRFLNEARDMIKPCKQRRIYADI